MKNQNFNNSLQSLVQNFSTLNMLDDQQLDAVKGGAGQGDPPPFGVNG